jgi:hypothetical protein
LPTAVVAEEQAGRPWGRLSKPSYSNPQGEGRSGYLGKYNPWQKGGEQSAAEPRYRKRETEKRSGGSRTGPYRTVPGYPPTAPATPYSGYPAWGSESYPVSPRQYSPYLGTSPRGGSGYNPYYGGGWSGPYEGLEPDDGILWSDMWRW